MIEQFESLIQNPVGTGAVTINFVDHDNRPEAHLESFLSDKPGLRHWPVYRVHQQQDRVDHAQDTLHLTAKVGMSRSVHDIDVVAIFAVVPGDGCILGQDRDPPLPLEFVRVHHPHGRSRPIAQRSRLLQHLVHERGFAMVDMGNYGNISELFDHVSVLFGRRAHVTVFTVINQC